MFLLIILSALAFGEVTTPQTNKGIKVEVQSDTYRENNLSRDQLYRKLKQLGFLSPSGSYRVIGLLEDGARSRTEYEKGSRQPHLDFSYPSKIPGLTSYWTVRRTGRKLCFQLSHVMPKAATIIGPAENWCILPN